MLGSPGQRHGSEGESIRLEYVIPAFVYAMAIAGGSAQAAGADTLDGFKADTIKAIFTELGATDMKSEIVQNDPRPAHFSNT
jgi:hypothetical protein